MSELDIAEAHVLDGLDFTQDVGHVLEELTGLIDGHVEDVGDRLALEAYLQCLTVVAFAVTLLAGYLDVGQEVHLDGLIAVAATRLTASALDVKRESTGLVAANLRFGQVDEQVSDIREDARIRGGIASRCTAYGTLVDVHHLIDIFQPLDALVGHGLL